MALSYTVSLHGSLSGHPQGPALGQAFKTFVKTGKKDAAVLVEMAGRDFSPAVADALARAYDARLLGQISTVSLLNKGTSIKVRFDTFDQEYEALPPLLSALGRCGLTGLRVDVEPEGLADEEGNELTMVLRVDKSGEVSEEYVPVEPEEFGSYWYLELGQAAEDGDMERARSSLDHGASPTVRIASLEGSALIHACWFAQPEVVKLFLERGVDPNLAEPLHAINANDKSPCSALMHAAAYRPVGREGVRSDVLQVVESLLKAGANPTWEARNSLQAIHLAREPAVIELLMKHGAQPQLPKKAAGLSVMLYSMLASSSADVFKFWLDHGLPANSRTYISPFWQEEYFYPILVKLSQSYNSARLWYLLEHPDLDVEAAAPDGKRAIEYLAESEMEDKAALMRIFIERGARWEGEMPA